MRRLLATAALLLVAALPLRAQFADQEYPFLTADPSCATGQYMIWTNTTSNTIKKCENGNISNIGTSAYTGTAAGPGGNQYDPERSPTSGTMAVCTDDFDAGSTGTWQWQNQNSATFTTPSGADYGVLFVNSGTTGIHMRLCTLNNSANWVMTVKFSEFTPNTSSAGAGLFFPEGACNSNTVVSTILIRNSTANNFGQHGRSEASRTSFSVQPTPDSNVSGMAATAGKDFCLQARYNVSTKVMTFFGSEDCRNWSPYPANSRTFTSHPTCGGFGIGNGTASGTTQMKVQWIRTRTDSAGTTAPFLVGE